MSTRSGGSRGNTAVRVRERTRSYATAATARPAPRAAQPEAEAAGTVRRIPLVEIHVGLNPREHFDEEGIRELADSIREHGLLQPISVRPHEGGYQVIAGERRLRASKLLGEATVPAIVHNVNDAKAHELALIENINRRDMRPGETARAYGALMQRNGLTAKQVAERTGKSLAHVQTHLDMLAMPSHLQKAVDEGRLPMGIVRDLAKLSHKGQDDAAERIISEDMGVRSAKAVIRAIYARENQLDLFSNVRTTTKTEQDAKARYEESIKRITDELSRLDDETMQAYAHALELPVRESQRLALMTKQLRRMQGIIEQTNAARTVGVPQMAARTGAQPRRASVRVKKSA